MKRITLMAAAALLAFAASAQTKVERKATLLTPAKGVRVSAPASVTVRDFVRPMPCLNGRGEVIGQEVGTICLPYVPEVEGATLYELVSASSTEFVFREVTNPQANTPYVFRINEGVEQVIFGGMGNYPTNLHDVASEAAGVEDAFVGSYRTHVIQEPIYFLSGDRIQYTDQPVYSTRFRAYFKANILPEGTVLSPDVRMNFISADGTSSLQQVEVLNNAVSVSRQNIGLQQGTYQLGGRMVEVK